MINNTTNSSTVPDFTAFMTGGWFLSAYYIGLIYPVVICVVGLPCNIANMVVMSRKWKLSPPLVYIGVLSVVDSVAILHKLLMIHLPTIGFRVSSHTCQYLQFVLQTTTQMSSWTLVLLTFERAMVIKCPFLSRTVCSVHRAGISVGVTTLTLFVYNCHWMFTVTANEDSKNCVEHEDFYYFLYHVWGYVDALFFSFLPSTCLLISNSVIVVCLRSRMKQMRNRLRTSLARDTDGDRDAKITLTDRPSHDYEPYQNSQAQRLMSRQFRQITRSTIIASIAFILMTTPYSITMASVNYTDYSLFSVDHAKLLLLTTSVYALRDAMHASNFFLYILPHSHVFKYFKRCLRAPSRCRSNNRSSVRYLSRKLTVTFQLSNNSNRVRA